MFNSMDFLLLNSLSDSELEREIENAEQYYMEIQIYFKQLELESAKNREVLPELGILFKQLKNVEWYIRNATDVLEQRGTKLSNNDINTDIQILQINRIQLA